MEIQQNVLYVMTQGAYVHRDHLTLRASGRDVQSSSGCLCITPSSGAHSIR